MNYERASARTFRAALILALCFAVSAPQSSAAETPLRIAIGTMPAARNDPHDSASITRLWLYAAVFDTLTFIAGDGNLQPWLAVAWTQDSPKSWVFKLRNGVKFSDGTDFTARSVADNLLYLKSPDGAGEVVSTYVAGVSDIQVIDPLTVRLVSHNPDPMLPRKLSLVRIAAIDGGAPMTRQALIDHAIGTGPYRLEAWHPAGATFRAAEHSWRHAPTKTLEAVSIPNPISRKNAMTTGRVDIASAAFEPDEAVDTSALPYDILVDPIPAVVGLAYNTTLNVPLRDVRVRRAMDLAIDKPTIINTLFSNLAPLATQPARRQFFGYDPSLQQTEFDPDQARRLLADAGYTDGFDLKMTLSGGATVWDQIFQAVADYLSKVKINLSIDLLPEPVLAEYHYQKGYPVDAFGTAYFSPAFDALDIMQQHSCLWPVAWYCDKNAMPLIEAALAEPDVARREELTRRVMRYAHDTAQGMFLYESIGLIGYNRRIKNFSSDFGFYRYELMTIEDK